MNVFLFILVILEALALAAFIFFVVKNNNSYKKILEKAELIVKGHLNVEDIQVVGGRKNKATITASAFNSVKSNLLAFVEATKGNVITLSDAINVLSKSVEANQQGNEHIADAISTVAVKAAEQLELVKNNLNTIESNNQQMQEIDQSMLQIKNLLDETVEISKNGINNLQNYERDMDAISTELTNSNAILTKFNDEIKRISEVGEFIIGISEQLKLLALNASIEAARAGQSGKGFAVVADEMNEMSSKTKEGMVTINQILGEVIQSSGQVNDSIKTCEETFNKSKQTFEDVNQSFQRINQQSFDIHDKIKDISDKIITISKNTAASKDMASELYEASQLISASTHEMAAASQETAAESSQIGENVDALDGMLASIRHLLKQFNTSVVPVDMQRTETVKIAFLSMLDNDFWYGVRRGAFYAQKELEDKNVIIEYTPLTNEDGKLDDHLRKRLRECIDQRFDGIILPGFLQGANDYLKEAIKKGIKVISFNCDCSKDIKKLACFSPDGNEAGTLAAKCMKKALDKRGNIFIVTGDQKVLVNKERKESFEREIKTCRTMHVLGSIIIEDVPEKVYKETVNILNSRSDIDAIYITSGMAVAVAKAIVDTGNAHKIILIGFDHNQEIYDYIKKGIIAAAIGQDPFGQGHDPIVWLYNHLVTGEPLPKVYMACRLSVVDKDNLDNLIEV